MLKKSFGQHLIKDPNILRKIVRLSQVSKDDVVVEVGAGQGDLTKCLAEKAGFVYAVEVDSAFRGFLERIQQECGNVEVVFGDILKIPLFTFRRERNIKVFGNIPYNITGPILFKILEERSAIDSAFLTAQREVATRIVSQPFRRTYGALSVLFQTFAEVKILFYLKPTVFLPPPKVESAFFSILLREDRKMPDDGLIGFIKKSFENKRKYMKYALGKYLSAETIDALYDFMHFSPSIRAEEVEPRKFEEMYGFLSSKFKVQSENLGKAPRKQKGGETI